MTRSPRSRLPRDGAGDLQPPLAPLLLLACTLTTLTAGPALSQAPLGTADSINVSAVGAQVGREVGRRWCAGEDGKQAVEGALVAYLSSQRLAPGDLPQKTTEALGKEIAVEAFGTAFATCPQRARDVFRTMMD